MIWKGHLVLATDHLVYIADARRPTHWFRFGTGLPSSVAIDLSVYPSGRTLLLATHGRGLWKIS